MRKKYLFILISLAFALIINGCGKGNKEELKVVFVSGSNEYFSHVSLPRYKKYLENNYENIQVKLLQASGELSERDEYSEIKGLEALNDCDVALFYTRRVTIDGEQLEMVKDYVNAGNPVVALRTASHGFQNWLEFDSLVLGCNYHGHHGGFVEEAIIDSSGNRLPKKEEPDGPIAHIKVNSGYEDHPVLTGIDNFDSYYSLYESKPLASDVKVLMRGSVRDTITEPAVWTRRYQGGKVCYIDRGGLRDFENPTFQKLLANALLWPADRKIPK